jgi:putative peptidoglycan lipid II flippase
MLSAMGYALSIVRDAVLATYYGRSPALDLYFVALSPLQFVGMEAASLAYLGFLPEFVRAGKTGEGGEYKHLLRRRLVVTLRASLAAAVLMAVMGMLSTPVLAPGHTAHDALGSLRATFGALALLIPGLAIAGVLRAGLEARGRFLPWALSPALRSGALILLVLLSASRPGLMWLVSGTLLGLCLVLAYFAIAAWATTAHLVESTQRVEQPLPASLGPLVGSILLGQLTVIIDNAFASHTGVGGVQAFVLASNLLSVPQTVIGGAVAAVFYPLFGRLWTTEQKGLAVESVQRSVRLVVYVLLPIVVFLGVGGAFLVRIIYERGRFDEEMTQLVASAVSGLAIGQVAYASSLLLRQFLLVAGVPWAVFQGAAVFLAVKWLGNVALTETLGLPGIAVSSSLAAISMCAFLASRVWRIAKLSAVRAA